MRWMKALLLLVGTWMLLAGADCNNPASDSNGATGGTAGTVGTGGIGGSVEAADFEGDWLGPARFLDCEYSDLDTPANTEGPAFGQVMVSIDSSGDVTQILIDGVPLSAPIDLGSVTSEFVPKNFLKLVFGGPPKPFPLDEDLGYAPIDSLDPIKGYVDDGGLIFEDPLPTANDGPPKSQHAFFFLHDIGGCDIAVGVLELNADSVPIHQDTELIGSWSGFGEAFFTDSPGVEETGWQGNIIQTVSAFDWCLTMDVGISATGTGQDFTGLGPPFTPFVDVSFITGGNILLNGWFEGTMITSDASTWWVEGFLSPDGDFFAGFTWPEDQAYEAGFRWQDLILTRVPTCE